MLNIYDIVKIKHALALDRQEGNGMNLEWDGEPELQTTRIPLGEKRTAVVQRDAAQNPPAFRAALEDDQMAEPTAIDMSDVPL